MSKPAIAAAGIVVFAAASMLLVVLLDAAPDRAAAAAAQPLAEARRPPGGSGSTAATAARSAEAPAARAGDAGAEEAGEVWAREPPRRTERWEAIPPVNGFAALGKIGLGLRMALEVYSENRLAQCFGGRDDLEPPVEEGVVAEDTRPVLLLGLEALPGAVRIVDASVEERGGAGDRLLACALAELRGATLAVPEASPGARHVLRYTVTDAARLHALR